MLIDRLEQSLNFHSQALHLRAERQQVLASNIANSDTPHYKARDFDFSAALASAEAGQKGGGPGGAQVLATTQRGHMGGSGTGSDGADRVLQTGLAYRNPTQPSLDGNTVDMDVERVQFLDNALHYRTNLQLLGKQIKGLKRVMDPVR